MISTQHSLIARLKDGASDADWERFYHLYERPILAFAASHSLVHSDGWDVLQETMVKMLRGGFKRFDPAKGAFTGFLFNVAKGCVIDAVRRRSRREARHRSLDYQSTEPEARRMVQVADSHEGPDAVAERHGQMALVALTLDFLTEQRVFQPRTVAIFNAVTFDGIESKEAARRFSTSVGNVYESKRAVFARLRMMLQALDRGMDLHEALASSKGES